jgi:hypothetical protein
MARTVRIEKRQRGVFGWIFLVAFWAWNVFMGIGLIGGIANNVEMADHISGEAQKAGHAIGTVMGAGMLFVIWVLGAILLGLFVMLTRGKKIITETVEA